MWDRLSPAILILPLSCCVGPRRARQILIVYVSDMGNNATADTDTGTDLDTKPKPKWDVHLQYIGDWAGILAEIPRPLIAGGCGSGP